MFFFLFSFCQNEISLFLCEVVLFIWLPAFQSILNHWIPSQNFFSNLGENITWKPTLWLLKCTWWTRAGLFSTTGGVGTEPSAGLPAWAWRAVKIQVFFAFFFSFVEIQVICAWFLLASLWVYWLLPHGRLSLGRCFTEKKRRTWSSFCPDPYVALRGSQNAQLTNNQTENHVCVCLPSLGPALCVLGQRRPGL